MLCAKVFAVLLLVASVPSSLTSRLGFQVRHCLRCSCAAHVLVFLGMGFSDLIFLAQIHSELFNKEADVISEAEIFDIATPRCEWASSRAILHSCDPC